MVFMVKSTPWSWPCLYIASPPRCPEVSWAHEAINRSPLPSQFRSTWATSVLAAWFYLLVVSTFFSGMALGHISIYMTYLYRNVFYPGSCVLPQCSSPYGFVSSSLVSLHCCSHPTWHLWPSIGQYRHGLLAAFLVQHYLVPDGWFSLLQTDLIHISFTFPFSASFCNLLCGTPCSIF